MSNTMAYNGNGEKTVDPISSRAHSDETDPAFGKHIYTLDERRRAALADVDNASFSWFHIKVCLVAGVGFYTDAYDLFAINIASTMLGYVYRPTHKSALSSNQDLGIKVASPVGTLVGQLLFGWLADVVGRKRMYGIELIIIIIGTFGQTLAGNAHGVNIFGVLVVWRFFMGVGIGGDYPLSAVISSEFASTRIRGRMMTAVFSAQGWGQFTAGITSLVLVAAFKKQIHADPITDPRHVDYMWRLLIGLGMVPAVVALYFRLTIPETPRFTMDIERNVNQASQDVDTFLTSGKFNIDPDAIVQRAEAPRASRRDFLGHFGKWENGKVLLGTAYSWFALDIAFYGLGLNNSIVLKAIGFGSPTGTGGTLVYNNLKAISIGNIILSVGGLIPGYYFTFFLIDSWGRKPIQLMGFSILTIIFASMGFAYDKLVGTGASPARHSVFVWLYCMANFFQNFGPNTTTFIIPGEVFPTRYRSTAHGISAASGKLGAIVAQVGFARLKDHGGAAGSNAFVKHILEIFALFMLTGVFSTLLIPETKGLSLEELSNESQEGFIKGVANKVQTTDGGIVVNQSRGPVPVTSRTE